MRIEFLEAKVVAGLAFELTSDFTDALGVIPSGHPERKLLALLEEALRREIHFIARHAEDYPQALFQCLWNSCWWYDCPHAVAHYGGALSSWLGCLYETAVKLAAAARSVVPHVGANTLPHWDEPGPKLHRLLEDSRAAREHSNPGFHWVRALRPPKMHLGTPQKAVFRGHEELVNSVAYSPDATRLASGSCDKTVRVWDAATGRELACLRGHEENVTSVAFSPDGTRLASGGRQFDYRGRRGDDTVRVWDAETGGELACLRGHENDVNSVAFSPDGTRLASGSSDDTVRVWDAETGGELACLRGHEGYVESVVFSPDGTRLASASGDGTVRVWDAATGQELACLRGHEDDVNSVAFSADGTRLASGSKDKTVRVWDTATGHELACLRGHRGCVRSVAFSPDGTRLASGSGQGALLDPATGNSVWMWDAATGRKLAYLCGHDGDVNSMAFSPDGTRLATASDDKTVRVWDAATGRELACLRGHEYCIRSAAFSPDGTRVISGSSGEVRVWDAISGACLEVIQGEGDAAAIAPKAEVHPLRALVRGNETVIEDAGTGKPMAWFPAALSHITTHPSESMWAGGVGNYLCLMRVERG